MEGTGVANGHEDWWLENVKGAGQAGESADRGRRPDEDRYHAALTVGPGKTRRGADSAEARPGPDEDRYHAALTAGRGRTGRGADSGEARPLSEAGSPEAAIPHEITPRVALGHDVDTGGLVTVTPEQLCSGCYLLGVQGVGKSTLLEQIACQRLEQDESVIVFDPHGQLIDNIVKRMPRSRVRDTFHLNLKDREYPFALNVFACANPEDEEERDRTRNRVTAVFEKDSRWSLAVVSSMSVLDNRMCDGTIDRFGT